MILCPDGVVRPAVAGYRCRPSIAGLALVFGSTAAIAFAGEEIPPYPYEAPAFVVVLRDKLKVQGTFELKDLSIREAAKKVASAAGVAVSFDSDAQEQAEKTTSLTTITDVSVASALNLIAASGRLQYRLTERGVVFTSEQEEAPWAAAEEIGRWIESFRYWRFPTKEEKAQQKEDRARWDKSEKDRKEGIEKIKKALRSTIVSRDFVDASFEKILERLAKESKVNLLIDPALVAKVRSEAKKLTIKGDNRTAEKVLKQLLGFYGFQYEFNEGIVYIRNYTKEEEAARNQSTFVFVVEQNEAERKFYNRKLTSDLKGSRICHIVKHLSQELGVKVYADSRAWGTAVNLPGKTAGSTFRQLESIFKRHGVEVVVSCSHTFYRPQPSYPDRPAPTKPLPGAPPVDWTIVLVKPKK